MQIVLCALSYKFLHMSVYPDEKQQRRHRQSEVNFLLRNIILVREWLKEKLLVIAESWSQRTLYFHLLGTRGAGVTLTSPTRLTKKGILSNQCVRNTGRGVGMLHLNRKVTSGLSTDYFNIALHHVCYGRCCSVLPCFFLPMIMRSDNVADITVCAHCGFILDKQLPGSFAPFMIHCNLVLFTGGTGVHWEIFGRSAWIVSKWSDR